MPDLTVILWAQPNLLDNRLRRRNKPLSRFERDHTRSDELSFYQDAADFLSCKGYRLHMLESDDDEPVEANTNRVVREIIRLRT